MRAFHWLSQSFECAGYYQRVFLKAGGSNCLWKIKEPLRRAKDLKKEKTNNSPLWRGNETKYEGFAGGVC